MAKEQNPNRQKISLKDMNERVLPMVGVKSDKPFNQKAIDQLMASNPAIAARVGMYNQILNGRPVMAAKGGFIFSPDELGNPRVKEEMKDNPEFSEFAIDQQDAAANKMQQRFAQPEDRMRQPARGYQHGGMPQQAPLLNAETAVSLPEQYRNNTAVARDGTAPPIDYTLRGGPSQVMDMRDRSMDGNLIADQGGPQDLRFRRIAQPLQPDSKIARADTRRFGEQPNILSRVPYDPPMQAFQPIGGRPGGQLPEADLAAISRVPIEAQLQTNRGPTELTKTMAAPQTDLNKLADAQKDMMTKTYTDPGSVITAGVTENIVPSAYNEIAAGTGQVTGDPSVDMPTATDVATTGVPTAEGPAGVMTATTAADKVKAATDAMTAATGAVSDDAQVTAATEDKSAVSDLTAAAGVANVMTNPVTRKIEDGEIVSGAANAATASAYTEQVEAATATPSKKATVKGQLDTLMDDFDGGETPVWAAGAMRAATAAMAARGLGASSMAGQALVQAAMESALPIAQADAATTAQFEAQNLSNRQQRAMLAAQQRATFIGQEFDQEFQARVANSARIGDIANMNFTAEQQIALENGRAANTMNMANLTNSQAMVMAEAAALSQLDISNLNNRQQAAVQNAQNFMQMDMQNLSNEQQTGLFKQQQITQALFTDQAAENAASQLNATSENQTQQFFASLANQTQQFNASQTNAMSQFDADNRSTLKRFNAELENQRDQFNATNGLAIAQSNAQWRQNATTLNTAAANEANMEYAKTVNGLTGTALDQLWQRERDLMSFAFTGSESAADRAVKIAVAKLTGDQKADLADQMGKGSFFSTILTGILGKTFGF